MKVFAHKGIQELNKWKNGILSIIYPSNCQVCSRELTEESDLICRYCTSEFDYTYYEKFKESPVKEIFWGRIEIHEAYSMLFYRKNSTTQKLIQKIKYQNGHLLAKGLGELLGSKMGKIITFNDLDGIVPIPLHPKKEFIRGYNQSLKICEGINSSTKIPILNLLRRKTHHESQTKKSRFDRWDNVASIFETETDSLDQYTHIAIIDDVLTTGATMEAAIRTLKSQNYNLKISVITIAVTKSI